MLGHCVSDPHNLLTWQDLLNFVRCLFVQPVRWHNMAATIKKQTVEPYIGDNEYIIVHHSQEAQHGNCTGQAKAVSAKIEDGNLRAAIRR